MPKKKPQKELSRTIKRPHLILCEGRDAEKYLIWLLGQFIKENYIFDEFQAWDFGGISDLKSEIKVLQGTNGFGKIQSLSIIRDAETNWQSAVQSIQAALRECGYAVPAGPAVPAKNINGITTGFVLFPTCDADPTNGTLEDLCLQTLADEKVVTVLQDIDSALQKYTFTRPHKNRLHAYFSCTDDFVGLKIGEAGKANAFSIIGQPIHALKNFLVQMTD